MTFTEAAIEVLRLIGKPLHYKKITELAIQKNLLSHVGKTPEVTMSSRLATLVKKEAADSLIIKVKPGVFGLRDFGREVIEAAAAELPDDPNAAAEEATHEALDAGEPNDDTAAEAAEAPAEAGEAVVAEKSAKKPSKPLPGSDVFPEEEDDDEPILGSLDKDDKQAQGGDKAAGADGGRRRRRRRRRGGPEGAESGTDAPRSEPAAERPARLERPERGPREERAPREERGLREERPREDRARDDRGVREDRLREEPLRGDPNREHVDGELVGKDLADAVFTVMAGLDRQPQTLARVAEQLVRRGRLAGDPVMLVPTIAAAVRADIARREAETVRPRFRVVLGRVALTDWSLPGEAVRFEQDAVRSADRQREQVRQAFLRRVRELPGAGFAELLATWLNVEGVVALRAVRRPGAQPGELHLAGTLKRGHDETRLAIVARRDGREIGRERVIEVRGALHHYGSASAGWLITTGQVLSGAREEAAVPGTAPVACFDGVGLARAMERVGVGLRRHVVPLTTLDLDLLDNLQGNAPPPPRVEDRPRDERPRDERRDGREQASGREGREGGRRERFARREEREARDLSSGAPEGAGAGEQGTAASRDDDARPADAERASTDMASATGTGRGADTDNDAESGGFTSENEDLSGSGEDDADAPESGDGDEAASDEPSPGDEDSDDDLDEDGDSDDDDADEDSEDDASDDDASDADDSDD